MDLDETIVDQEDLDELEECEDIVEELEEVGEELLQKEEVAGLDEEELREAQEQFDAMKSDFLENLEDEQLFDKNKQGDYSYGETGLGLYAKGSLTLDKVVERNPYRQLQAGGDLRLETDDGGHLIGNRFGGSSEMENLVAQNSNLNRSTYKRYENELADRIKAGDKVYLEVETYAGNGGQRPTAFMAYSITEDADGKRQWDAVSFPNASNEEQAEWEREVDEMEE